jgi:peptide/nickel transport system permease protein
MAKEKKTGGSPKKESTLKRWIMRALFPKKELDIYAEEQLQSPFMMVAKNFFSKPLSVISLVLLICIMLFVFIAPNYVTLDLGEADSTLVNVSPGYSMMKYPKALVENGVQDISVGYNYSVACDKQGNVYVWGKTRVTKVVNMADVPKDVVNAKIVMVAAGKDHALAVDDKGVVYAWGSERLQQTMLPDEVKRNNRMHEFKIVAMQASNQFSCVLTDTGYVYLWGNTNFVDTVVRPELQGHIVDVSLTNDAFVVLLDDGSVQCPVAKPKTTVQRIPEGLESGVVQIASTTYTTAALKADGTVKVWGAFLQNENVVPEFSAKVKDLQGGRYHYTALMEDGSVVCWGGDRYKQSQVPKELAGKQVVDLSVGSFQNYALDSEGKLHTWGLKGFLMGTDNLGRDVFARLVNGGKMTMTIGALAVVIETIIGVILGGLAGYFGGVVDMVIMRAAEVIGSMPFIPFSMILSAVIGTKISVNERMYLIMVILGVLSWPGICSLVRAQMLAQREMEYVTAAKTVGVKESRIIFKHIIPNVMSVCLVSITLAFGTSMLTESTLSYLGFGVPLPTPTWGNMLDGANNSIVIQNYWWNWVFVGSIFGITCMCINLIGDGLRDALDPKASGR